MVNSLPRQPCRILYVEDDLELLESLSERLSMAGYEVDTASNGFRAVSMVGPRPDKYQLILTDIRMPGLDGYGVIEQARSAGYQGAFIVYAASMTSDHRERLRELRVQSVIEKPVPFSSLLATIREVQQAFP